MTHAIDVGLVAILTSWILHVVLGAWVLRLTPRRRQTLLLGGFFLLHGLGHAIGDLATAFDLPAGPITNQGRHLLNPNRHVLYDLGDTVEFLGHVTVLVLAAWVPRRLEERRPMAAALALGVGVTALFVSRAGLFLAPEFYPRLLIQIVDLGVFLAPAVLLALRAAPSRDPTVSETTQLAILGLAIAFIVTFASGGGGSSPRWPDPLSTGSTPSWRPTGRSWSSG